MYEIVLILCARNMVYTNQNKQVNAPKGVLQNKHLNI